MQILGVVLLVVSGIVLFWFILYRSVVQASQKYPNSDVMMFSISLVMGPFVQFYVKRKALLWFFLSLFLSTIIILPSAMVVHFFSFVLFGLQKGAFYTTHLTLLTLVPVCLFNYFVVKRRMNNFGEVFVGEMSVQKNIEIDYYNREGTNCCSRGQYDDARRSFAKVLSMREKENTALFGLGVCEYFSGSKEKAFALMQQAAKYGNKEAEIYLSENAFDGLPERRFK